jgi:lysozyme family protein
VSELFEHNFKQVILDEGGWSDRKTDPGGKTMWGVTEAVAREHGYTGEMRDLPLETAKAIAKKAYWDVLNLDAVGEISPDIAGKLFNAGYNCGVGVVGRFLQRALNAFNMRGAHYGDVGVDGAVGNGTVGALKAYIAKRGRQGDLVMLRALNCLQGARYIELGEKNSALEDYEFGWFAQRIGI